MFLCQQCGAVTPPRTSAELAVVESRPKVYPFRREVQRELIHDERRKAWVKRDDPGGVGREIVREIRVCQACKTAFQDIQASSAL